MDQEPKTTKNPGTLKSALGIAAKALLVFLVLFIIGMGTRMPALLLLNSYAIHGVLAAAFDAFLFAFVLRRGWSFASVAIGCVCFGLCLGGMHLVMGIAAIVPLALSAIVWVATKSAAVEVRSIAAAATFAGAIYPVTLAAGCAWGSCSISTEGGVLTVSILVVLGVALGVIGGVIGERAGQGRAK